MNNAFFALIAALAAFAYSPILVARARMPFQLSEQVLTPGRSVTLSYVPDMPHARLFAHYGFNGWNLPVSALDAGQEIEQGNLNHFVRRAMIRTGDRYTARIDIPESARALHMVFCWDECGAGQWDNNAGQDYSWPIIFPYIGPILSWNEQTTPENGIVISFENSWPAEAWLRVWKVGEAPRVITSAAALTHRFVLTDLTAASSYQYQVGVGTTHTSDVHSFKTRSRPASQLSFAVVGDAQDNGENGKFAVIAESIRTHQSDVDAVLSTGDLPWNDKPGDWWSFFDKGRKLFASLPFMPVLGNHDTPTMDSSPDHSSFFRYFALPRLLPPDRAFYDFKIGSASFFGMNSERPGELQVGGPQYLWLQQELARQSSEWNFVYWHIPPYNAGERHWQQQFRMRTVTSLFNGVVDWQLSGHEHLGQRMKPLRYEESLVPRILSAYGNADDQGVGYLVIPGGGVMPEQNLVSLDQQPDLRALLAFPDSQTPMVSPFSGYARIDINGRTMSLSTIAVDVDDASGANIRVVDAVNYTK